VIVPEADRLGQLGAGGAIFHDSMVWEKGCLFAAYVGAMERVYEQCLEHVKQRIQFSKPIGENQSVSNRIIDMKLRLDSSRLMLYRAGWLYDQGQDSEAEIALSKIMISEAAVQTGLDAIQLFGASAIENEMEVSRLLLDAIPSRIFSGSNDIQKEIIARKLGLRKV
jgi:alkylation response protein AidB-like acyl-CoA dehydrogenase